MTATQDLRPKLATIQAHADQAQNILDHRYGTRTGHHGHTATCRCPACITTRQAQYETTGRRAGTENTARDITNSVIEDVIGRRPATHRMELS